MSVLFTLKTGSGTELNRPSMRFMRAHIWVVGVKRFKELTEEGWRGFYKGLAPNLTRVVPATAITFVVYETVSRQLAPRVPAPGGREQRHFRDLVLNAKSCL
ncbi:Mitochondrial folate transporter/carrier [Amphibalanus amphitrite]|uniref:Mitochondrial folate transporter/carrier n=1 Tax=Amphibalanus amphitrite TaxID=1232801 RepID=A0A6A4VLY7_AMPAM|nr:Mitochondrial folate transporter/carrier [Amphibalanus amphitrite]